MLGAGLVVALSLGLVSRAIADVPDSVDEATVAAECLLGNADEEAQAYLPFTRQLSASSTVTGSLALSTAAAGVPPATMPEALRAIGTAIDLERDLRNGDRFHVRYEQTFTIEGQPIGVGRVIWLELKTAAKGTVAVHRFRSRDAAVEQFWLASGRAAAPPSVRLPLDTVTVSSGFGWRADPLDHPPGLLAGLKPPAEPAGPAPPPEPTPEETAAMARDDREIARAAAGFGSGGTLGSARDVADPAMNSELDRVMAERRARARREKEETQRIEREAAVKASEPVALAPAPAPRKLFMHEGMDLVANAGTPVYAASDGAVIGAGPNGGYGNWIRIRHAGKLTTVYGHLSRLAPGVETGSMVARGELIGFVGNTGRSTGAHLHFELLSDGRPVNPHNHPATRADQLAGADLERFRKQVAAALGEREREAAELHVSRIDFPPHSYREVSAIYADGSLSDSD